MMRSMLHYSAAAAAKSLRRVRLCDPMDGSPPGSSAHGNFQARVLEWGATVKTVDTKFSPQEKNLQLDANETQYLTVVTISQYLHISLCSTLEIKTHYMSTTSQFF